MVLPYHKGFDNKESFLSILIVFFLGFISVIIYLLDQIYNNWYQSTFLGKPWRNFFLFFFAGIFGWRNGRSYL